MSKSVPLKCRLIHTSDQACVRPLHYLDCVLLKTNANFYCLDLLVLDDVRFVSDTRLRILAVGISFDSHSKTVIMCVAFL